MRLLVVAFLAVLAVSLFGWGKLFRRLLGMPRGLGSVTMVLGLGVLIFIGGVLNLLRLAYGPALWLVVLAGVVLAIPRRRTERVIVNRAGWAIYGIVTLVTLGFVVYTQLPPSAFNAYDDYQKYFAHPVRMLETGTVYGSALSTMGSATLGGQALMQGTVLSFAPLPYINGADAVLGLFLCLTVAAELAMSRPKLLPVMLASVLAVVLLNPQYVNVTSMYLAAAMMMAIVALAGEARELQTDSSLPNAGAIGLLYAGLVSAKMSFALVVAVHAPLLVLAVFLSHRSAGTAARFALRGALFSLLFIGPWIALHAPHYLSSERLTPTHVEPWPHPRQTFDFLSRRPLQYGTPPIAFTMVLAAAIGMSVGAGWTARSSDLPRRSAATGLAASGVALVASFLIMVVVLSDRLSGVQVAVRYCTPILIGMIPPILAIAAVSFDDLGIIGRHPVRMIVRFVALVMVPLAAFVPSTLERIRNTSTHHSALAFNMLLAAPAYAAYNEQVLYGDVRRRLRTAQDAVPAGEPLIAWVNTPFYLDFRRNPIHEIDTWGAARRWASLPRANYLVLSYAGYATTRDDEYRSWMHFEGHNERHMAAYSFRLLKELRELAARGRKLHDDGEIAVYALPVPR